MTKKARVFAEVLEDEAREQFMGAMEQDFVVAGALMPDAHVGYSLPIGAVIATKDVILPSWVGFDIGCGVCALPLPGLDLDIVKLRRGVVFENIYRHVPVGFASNLGEIEYSTEGLTEEGRVIAVMKRYKKALGSLGGGNHFIEIGYEERNVWVIIHSGSRGVGRGIASHYMSLAHPEGKAKDGHFGFLTSSDLGQEYITDLDWCLEYALENRRQLMLKTVKAIEEIIPGAIEIDLSRLINRNHNHAVLKDGLWVHRKGATHAEKGMIGVIPGNMRDGSFIVMGKGFEDALCSSSHGAGRVLSRKKAKATLDVGEFARTMHGVTAKVGPDTLDESPGAYKDIYEVMELQKDMVEVVAHVKPLINIKG